MDALIDKFTTESKLDEKKMEKAKLLSSLAQKTAVFLLTNGDCWLSSMTSILRQSSEGGLDSVVQCLEWIHADWQLIQRIWKNRLVHVWNRNSKMATINELLNLLAIGKHKIKLVANLLISKNAKASADADRSVEILYHFRRHCHNGHINKSTCQKQIIEVLKKVEKFDSDPRSNDNKCVQEISQDIKHLICSQLWSIIASAFNPADVDWCHNLLQDTHQFLLAQLDQDPTAKLSLNYEKLLKYVGKGDSKKSALNWALRRLGYTESTVKVSDVSGEKNVKKIEFILNNVPDLNVEILDCLREWSCINPKDDERIEWIDHLFLEIHWKPKWMAIDKILANRNSGEKEASAAICEWVHTLKMALNWKYCRFISYKEKMDLCAELETILKSTSQAKINEWLKEKETQLMGKSCETTFVNFFRQLSSSSEASVQNKVSKKVKELFGRSIQSFQVAQQLKHALFTYENVQFSGTREIKELNEIMDNLDDRMMKNDLLRQDWTDLKEEHRKNWASTYLRHWIDTRKSQDESCQQEIGRIKKRILNRECWNHEEVIYEQINVLLSKYLRSTGTYLSPTVALEHWKSLEKMNVSAATQMQEEIKKATTAFGKH